MVSLSEVLIHTLYLVVIIRETYSIFLNKERRSARSVKVINTQFARIVHMIIMLNNVRVAVKKNKA